jgi:NitT/TauT family transport system permease protein
MSDKPYYKSPKSSHPKHFNSWDAIILLLVFGVLTALALGTQNMIGSYHLGEQLPISLDPWKLPHYALNSVVRMAIALCVSFLFTFSIGTLAAKNQKAERIIIPFIDIMQSIPILGFQSISILFFVHLFQGSQLGPECAAVFAIFTSQVWNMVLSFYQSLKTLPKDLRETAAIFQLNAWQKFWRIEVPYAMPTLLWNTMVSLSAGWFFVVASEAISVNNQYITLPGIGSYIHVALLHQNSLAIGYAVFAMFLIILLYDQLIFRPLLTWSERFKIEPNIEIDYEGTWFLNYLHRSLLIRKVNQWLLEIKNTVINIQLPKRKTHIPIKMRKALQTTSLVIFQLLVVLGTIVSLWLFWNFISNHLSVSEAKQVLFFGLITACKVSFLIVLVSLIWVPIGTFIGLNPKFSRVAQPIAQFAAAFPADILYPLLMMLIITYEVNADLWSTPLMILGTQWYILFNVIAGVQALPLEVRYAAQNYGIKGWLWWKRIILPALFPYYITGAITAAGGCWNASIIADVLKWGDKEIYVTGLGSYIARATAEGDFPRIALGIGIMCLLVTVINRLIWRRLYNLAETRYRMESTT